MRAILCSCICLLTVSSGFAQTPDPPLDETRLSVHTLLREDVFAGWRADDMERFARAEKNIEQLMQSRPKSRADLLAWKGGTAIYRAVLALEAGETEEFDRHFQQTQDCFAEAKQLAPKSGGVAAVVGGSYVLFADRLPEEHQAQAWSDCYDNYQVLWKLQGPFVDKLPVHIGGELLSGLAQSAQRTKREAELGQFLDKIIEVMPNTRYGRVAQEWKNDPQAAAGDNISCKTCHAPGRLSRKLANFEKE